MDKYRYQGSNNTGPVIKLPALGLNALYLSPLALVSPTVMGSRYE